SQFIDCLDIEHRRADVENSKGMSLEFADIRIRWNWGNYGAGSITAPDHVGFIACQREQSNSEKLISRSQAIIQKRNVDKLDAILNIMERIGWAGRLEMD